MEAKQVRIYARITGRVQGVCYRWFTRDTAAGLGLTGWVRNLPDGSVEMLAEGSQDRIDQLLEWCRQGPDLARVEDLDVKTGDATGEFSDFAIRH